MKRVITFLAVVALFVGGVAIGVSAQSDGTRTPARDNAGDRLVPFSPAKVRQLERMLERTRDLRVRGRCPSGPLSIEKINCNLTELKRFARSTQNQLVDLEEFVLLFSRCTSFRFVTQYGDPAAGAFGYVYDPGTGVTFKTSALDFTVDPDTEFFDNFYVVTPTPRCIEFHQG